MALSMPNAAVLHLMTATILVHIAEGGRNGRDMTLIQFDQVEVFGGGIVEIGHTTSQHEKLRAIIYEPYSMDPTQWRHVRYCYPLGPHHCSVIRIMCHHHSTALDGCHEKALKADL